MFNVFNVFHDELSKFLNQNVVGHIYIIFEEASYTKSIWNTFTRHLQHFHPYQNNFNKNVVERWEKYMEIFYKKALKWENEFNLENKAKAFWIQNMELEKISLGEERNGNKITKIICEWRSFQRRKLDWFGRTKQWRSGFRMWNWQKFHWEKKEKRQDYIEILCEWKSLKVDNEVDLEEQDDDVLSSEYGIDRNFIRRRKKEQ